MLLKSFKKNKKTNEKGNITILVLIMGLAVILLTTAMVGYIFRDVGFTKLDENELRALNIAEAGISNMFMEIEKFNNGETNQLPASPYSGYVVGDGVTEGQYLVEHESYSTGENYKIYGYSIKSKGTDKSGIDRIVRVKMLTLNIYDFIYSEQSLSGAQNIAGNTTIIGPFLVNGELDVTVGTAQFLEGPLFVKENIIIGGDAAIGEPSTPIDLFLGGSMFDNNGAKLDPLNPVGANVYIDNFYNSVFNITFPEIDETYLNYVRSLGGVLEITGDLFIGDGVIELNGTEVVGGYDGYLEFNGGDLLINGNTIVNGNITFGQTTGTKYNIKYIGKANLIATGSTYVYSQLIPLTFINFPQSDLLVLISLENTYLYLNGSLGGTGIDNPNAAVMVINNGITELQNGVILRGSTISKSLIADQNVTIYYEEGISNYLPAGVPEIKNILFTVDWQELLD